MVIRLVLPVPGARHQPKSAAAEVTTAVALIDLPGIVQLDLTLASGSDGLTVGLQIESPVFNPASGIGIQLSVKTDIVTLNLTSGSIKASDYFPSLVVALSVRHPEEDGATLPLFSYEDPADTKNNVSLDSIELEST